MFILLLPEREFLLQDAYIIRIDKSENPQHQLCILVKTIIKKR